MGGVQGVRGERGFVRFSVELFRERLRSSPVKVAGLKVKGPLHIKMLDKMQEQQPDIWERIKGCRACPVANERAFGPILPSGNRESKAVFVGNMPGKLEGENDHSFHKTSISGKYVDKYLDALGLGRNDVYLTNALLCPTKEGRDPTVSELYTCSFHKFAELELLSKMRWIFLLGNHAAQQFLGVESIVPNYGTSYSCGGRMIFCLFHPGTVTRDRKLYDAVMEQLAYIKANYLT